MIDSLQADEIARALIGIELEVLHEGGRIRFKVPGHYSTLTTDAPARGTCLKIHHGVVNGSVTYFLANAEDDVRALKRLRGTEVVAEICAIVRRTLPCGKVDLYVDLCVCDGEPTHAIKAHMSRPEPDASALDFEICGTRGVLRLKPLATT